MSFGPLDKIDLDTVGVSVEIDVRSLAGVERVFHGFKDDEVLEKSATQRAAGKLRNIYATTENGFDAYCLLYTLYGITDEKEIVVIEGGLRK